MKKVVLIVFITCLAIKSQTQTYKNPIIKGFNPDPSICKVNDMYYLVTSSFEYFPGIPVYKSKDLINWKLTDHVWNRNTQLNLDGYIPSDGLYAPSIRYFKEKLYVVVSLVQRSPRSIKNLLFVSDLKTKEWSDPIVLTDTTLWSIDPSLFFDDDGRCYFTANRKHQVIEPYNGYREIAMQELDLDTYKLKGEIKVLTSGFVKDAKAAEAPHIYKKDGRYYLLIAEGGTGINHAVTMGVSSNIFGPYKSCPYNPILSHRHLQETINIRNIGHADIVQDSDNRYWLVCLGVRYLNNKSFMGRETFLVPMDWDKKRFPVINPGIATVQLDYKLGHNSSKQAPDTIFHDEFDGEELNKAWTNLRFKPSFIKTTSDGYLNLKTQKSTLAEYTCPAFIGKRIENHSFKVSMKMAVNNMDAVTEAGLVLLAENNNFIKFVIQSNKAILKEVLKGETRQIASFDIDVKKFIYFNVSSDNQKLSFQISNDGKIWTSLYKDFFSRSLCKYTFTGSLIGIYATSNGFDTDDTVLIDWFEYKNL